MGGDGEALKGGHTEKINLSKLVNRLSNQTSFGLSNDDHSINKFSIVRVTTCQVH